MKRLGIWILFMCKRLLKRPSFVIILCLLPCLLFSYRYLISEESGAVRVGLYFEDTEAELSGELREALLANDIFAEFYVCQESEELYLDVAAGRAECGYVFPADLPERFLQRDWEAAVTLVVSDNSRYADYISEAVYARLFFFLADELVTDYLATHVDFGGGREEIELFIAEQYRQAASSADSIFEFHYVDGSTGEIQEQKGEKDADHNYLTKPIRGTVALFVLLAGLAGLVFWFQDEREGRFAAFAYYKRPVLSLGSLLLPVLLGGVVGLLCLELSGVAAVLWRELAAMLLYCLLVTAFCNLLRLMVPSVNAVCAMIPILSIASYLCCPVIMDIKTFVPALAYIRPILVVDYYLETFLQPAQFWRLAAAVLLLPVTVVSDYWRQTRAKS